MHSFLQITIRYILLAQEKYHTTLLLLQKVILLRQNAPSLSLQADYTNCLRHGMALSALFQETIQM